MRLIPSRFPTLLSPVAVVVASSMALVVVPEDTGVTSRASHLAVGHLPRLLLSWVVLLRLRLVLVALVQLIILHKIMEYLAAILFLLLLPLLAAVVALQSITLVWRAALAVVAADLKLAVRELSIRVTAAEPLRMTRAAVAAVLVPLAAMVQLDTVEMEVTVSRRQLRVLQ